VTAVDDCSLQVAEGTVTALIDPTLGQDDPVQRPLPATCPPTLASCASPPALDRPDSRAPVIAAA